MRVVAWGTYDLGKPRVRILLRGLEEAGVEVCRCHWDLWRGVPDKSALGLLDWLRFGAIALAAYPLLLWRYLRLPRHDFVLVSYPGHVDVLVVWVGARLRGIPVVWDAFLSIYDTVVTDRGLLRPEHFGAQWLRRLDGWAAGIADLVLMDTRAGAEHFRRNFGLDPEKIASVWVGVESERFPERRPARAPGAPFTILFYGQLSPLHGVETIVRAARAGRGENLHWLLIGQGQDEDVLNTLLREQPLENLRWERWVPYEQLSERIGAADVCLGVFGASEKAGRVIPNKVFQILQAGGALVTRDGPGIRELLDEGPGIRLVPAADPERLLQAIRELRDSGERPSEAARGRLRARIAPRAIGEELRATLAAWRRPA
jgi:glycosyltransferase involved in cell wall biosynthesis